MTEQELRPFCDLTRKATAYPWSEGKSSYASNGRIIIRVPRVNGSTYIARTGKGKHATTASCTMSALMAARACAEKVFAGRKPCVTEIVGDSTHMMFNAHPTAGGPH